MRLLIADDEEELLRAISEILRYHGYQVMTARNGESALELLKKYGFDGVILDIMMPGKSGLEVLKEIRKESITTPVLLLTAKGEIDSRIHGLEEGADDYLGKPFHMGELIARVGAMTRRKTEYTPKVLEAGDTILNRETFSLSVKQTTIQLSPLEFQLMELLMVNKDRWISTEQIQERLKQETVAQEEKDKVEQIQLYLFYLIKKLELLQAKTRLQIKKDGSCMLETKHD